MGSARMSRRQFERAIAMSRNGNVAGALDAMKPKTKGKRSAADVGAGRAAQSTGASFQTEVRDSLKWYADAGALVWNEGNPRVVGMPGFMRPVEKATVDFQVLARFVAIVWDCKTFTGRESWTLATVGDPKERERHERQVRWLLDARKQGAIAFLLLHEPKRDRAWLCFQLHTLAEGGTVQIRSVERAARGVPERLVDHMPVLEPNPRLVGPRWRILEAALAHGLKTLPGDSPFRTENGAP